MKYLLPAMLLLISTQASAVSSINGAQTQTWLGGKVTKAVAALSSRRLFPGVSALITHKSGNQWDSRFMYKGALNTLTFNKYPKYRYNLKLTMNNGSFMWIKSSDCQADAVHYLSRGVATSGVCL